MTPGRIVVVGASLGGVRTIKALRRKGYDGDIVFVGEEPSLPYDRPPLSKGFLTDAVPTAKLLEPEAFYDDVQLRLGRRAESLRPRDRAVVLDDGTWIEADQVVIATGASPRMLPDLVGDDRATTLRTLEDAMKLRAALDAGGHLLIIGAGFVGCEVAAAARQRGIEVTVVEPGAAPVVRGVGAAVGNSIAALHRSRGVDLRLGTGVAGIESLGDRRIVTLTDGTRLETDFIVVGIGAAPRTDWLEDSGLTIANGVLCDAQCRAVGAAGTVWALGDVAVWPSGIFGTTRRVEHWTNAAEQAAVVAAGILSPAEQVRHDPVPYVWSDQYEHKVQILGNVSGDDEMTLLRGNLDDMQFAMAYTRGGILRGLVASDMPREVVQLRPLIAAAEPLEAAMV